MLVDLLEKEESETIDMEGMGSAYFYCASSFGRREILSILIGAISLKFWGNLHPSKSSKSHVVSS